jgi:hypothetical protein
MLGKIGLPTIKRERTLEALSPALATPLKTAA